MESAWAGVMREGARSNPVLRIVLTNSVLTTLDADRAVLACPPRFAADARKHLDTIAGFFHRSLGRSVRIEVQESGSAPPRAIDDPGQSPPSAPQPAQSANPPDHGSGFDPDQAVEHPLVKQAIELFGAKVVNVQPRRSG